MVSDPGTGNSQVGDGPTEIMEIAQQMVGRVIGRQGETIKGLQVQSGAHITIDQAQQLYTIYACFSM